VFYADQVAKTTLDSRDKAINVTGKSKSNRSRNPAKKPEGHTSIAERPSGFKYFSDSGFFVEQD
jgi:hypothetical protein